MFVKLQRVSGVSDFVIFRILTKNIIYLLTDFFKKLLFLCVMLETLIKF